MTTRIYVITIKPIGLELKTTHRLVRTSSPAQALRHVVDNMMSAEYASQDDLVRLLGAGVKVEAVNVEDNPSTT